ncbi:hypothetical protein, partial [Pseudomonas sp. EMN2]|uniref:hypothetical protein n=1 Tax=Pseudomonas sp. EMN2 TaxID=2615212 RepID=UPI001C498D7B
MKINVGRVRDYLIATLENAQDHANESPELMHLIAQMGDIFHDEIFSLPLSQQSAADLLIINAYTMLLAGVRAALSGHVVCVFPIVRAALESSCYAYIIVLLTQLVDQRERSLESRSRRALAFFR